MSLPIKDKLFIWIAEVRNGFYTFSGKRIQTKDLGNIGEKLGECDRFLFYTGQERFYPEDIYYQNFPALSRELAYWLVEKKISLIGIDTSSVAAVDDWDEVTTIHKVLLSNGIILIEGLSNLDKLPFGHQGYLICLPMKLLNTDGTLARVIAILEEDI